METDVKGQALAEAARSMGRLLNRWAANQDSGNAQPVSLDKILEIGAFTVAQIRGK